MYLYLNINERATVFCGYHPTTEVVGFPAVSA